MSYIWEPSYFLEVQSRANSLVVNDQALFAAVNCE